MEEILKNLQAIERWIDTAPDISNLRTDDDFMVIVTELMSYTLYVLRIGASSAPSEEISQKGYSKQRAVIVGHMIQIVKLYEGILMHISERQLELAIIFSRLIFETSLRMRYLIVSKHKRKSFRSFLLASHKPERDILADLEKKAEKRPLIPIEKRIKNRIRELLKRDKITLKALRANRIWNVDGKNFKDLLRDLKFDAAYSYMFGSGSHSIHGDWKDINQYHIEREGRYYFPKLQYTDPDPRVACAMTTVCLDALSRYLQWNKSDVDNVLSLIISKLTKLNSALDMAHEKVLNTKT